MPGAGYDFLLGPLVALAAVGVLAVVLRWVYGGSPRPTRNGRRTRPPDFGLLVRVATAPSEEAERLRDLLAGHGIRSTLVAASSDVAAVGAPSAPGTTSILVFREDEATARHLVNDSRR